MTYDDLRLLMLRIYLLGEFRVERDGVAIPAEAWTRTGIASGYTFTVNALAYIIAGHVVHHRGLIEARYL